MSTIALQSLIHEVDSLLVAFANASDRYREQINRTDPAHRNGAENLVHYVEMRGRDMRQLQQELERVAGSRLSAPESDVRARVMAVRNVVGALAGQFQPYFAGEIADALAMADEVLEWNSTRLLGPAPQGQPAHIMVTLPSEAADNYELVEELAQSGMTLARINCAHESTVEWKRMIDHVRAAEHAVGREIKVSMDLAGPKLRTGANPDGPRVGRARVTREESGVVLTPAKLWLVPRNGDDGGPALIAPEFEGYTGRPTLPVTVDREWFEGLTPGTKISINDSRGVKRSFMVEMIREDGALAIGDRNVYISDGTLLEANYERTRAGGIPPLVQRLVLETGDRLILVADDIESILPAPDSNELPRLGCTLPLAVESLAPGDPVLFDDGAISAVVENIERRHGEPTEALLRVTRAKPGGQKLAAFKGINLPSTDLAIPALTDEDKEHLRFVARHADIAAISFVRTVFDVQYVLEFMAELAEEARRTGDHEYAQRVESLGLALKIETIPGFNNLPEILLEGMRWRNICVMIARGDLAVELGFDRMSEVPQHILAVSEAAHVPTILATQVLENMAKAGLPSRAEITDAAMALRAECVMLNKGPHVTDAVRILKTIGTRMGEAQRKSRVMLRHIHSWDRE